MSESLKPCPLPKCGGDAVVWKHGSVVSCSKCHFTSLLEHWQELPRTDQTAQKIAEELRQGSSLGGAWRVRAWRSTAAVCIQSASVFRAGHPPRNMFTVWG
jgi:ribosomal protein S27AE